MMNVGRICIKTAGRDAGKKCVIVEEIDSTYVFIDGQTRRRKCNVNHLEPLSETIKIKAKATHNDVVSAFKKLEIEITETKPRKIAEKPKKQRKQDTPKETPTVEKKKTIKKEKVSKAAVPNEK